MKKDLDRVLKHALTPTEEPDAWLDRNILYQAEEMADMAKKKEQTEIFKLLKTALDEALEELSDFDKVFEKGEGE